MRKKDYLKLVQVIGLDHLQEQHVRIAPWVQLSNFVDNFVRLVG
jgi:hypothetical protein